ncbi:MAG TPA: NADH-quinone oxidoreductase subunit C [Vicinamibacterales bacterium]|jgi:NADH:ubiquinone oxidoreductase subunit C
MDTAQTLTTAQTLLQPVTVGAPKIEGHRLDIPVKREDLLRAVKILVDAHWGYLSAITGLDLPWPKPKPGIKPAEPAPEAGPLEDELEALYHFASGAAVATIRVRVPYHDTRIPSICPIIPSATLYERELQEMLGFIVEGTPVPDKLLLPDDWPAGLYPLRKSFTGAELAGK